MTWSRVSVLVLALCTPAATAAAQGRDDDPTRRRLILEAGALRDQGDHAGALERLRAAAARRQTPSLQLFLAQEERAIGRDDLALRDARGCADAFEENPALSHREEFLATCRVLAAELEGRVGRIVVRMPGAVRAAAVSVGGEPLPAVRWGAPWEVLPGAVTVTATAPGREPFREEVFVRAGATVELRVELSPGTQPSVPDPPAVAGPARFPVGPVSVLAFGGVGLTAAAVLFALRSDALDARDALCGTPAGDCVVPSPAVAEEAERRQQRAATFNTLSALSVAVGGAALLGGAIWFALSRNTRAPTRAAVTLAPGGVSVLGRW